MAIEFIEILIRINLALAAGVAIVMALRIPARRFFGARVAYALWVLPLIAAAMCFVPGRIEHIVLEAPAVSPALSVSSAPEPPYLLWAWASGALLCLAVLALRQLQFTRALGRLAAREDIGPDVRSAQTTTHGPAVLGVIRPLIITPADFETRFDAEEQRIVLAHERAHLAQGDPWINAVMLAVQCVNWFNPFVHIAARALRMDQELACDASVLENEGALRRRYAEAMLKTHISATAPLGCAWPPANLDALKERISMLKRALPSRAQRLLGATAIVAATAATAAVAWAAQPTRIVTTFEEREVVRLAGGDSDVDVDQDIDVNIDAGPDGSRVDDTTVTLNVNDENDPGRRIVIRNGEVIENRELTAEERREVRRTTERARETAARAREQAAEAREAAREAAAEGREAAREAREAAREATRLVEVHRLTAEEREEIREAVREAREAIAEVEVHEFSEADRAEVRAALDQARVAVDQARIQAEVHAATREQVRAAMIEARAEMERSRVVLANLEPMSETLAEIAADLREEAAEARAEGARERAAEMDRAAEQLERRARNRR